jgi:hypothetical protein
MKPISSTGNLQEIGKQAKRRWKKVWTKKSMSCLIVLVLFHRTGWKKASRKLQAIKSSESQKLVLNKEKHDFLNTLFYFYLWWYQSLHASNIWRLFIPLIFVRFLEKRIFYKMFWSFLRRFIMLSSSHS